MKLKTEKEPAQWQEVKVLIIWAFLLCFNFTLQQFRDKFLTVPFTATIWNGLKRS